MIALAAKATPMTMAACRTIEPQFMGMPRGRRPQASRARMASIKPDARPTATTCVEVAECGATHKMVLYPIRLSWVSGSGREPDRQNCNIKLSWQAPLAGPKTSVWRPNRGADFRASADTYLTRSPPLASMSRAYVSLFEAKLCRARQEVQAGKARVRNSARHCAERK
jgi:hypothetical protein